MLYEFGVTTPSLHQLADSHHLTQLVVVSAKLTRTGVTQISQPDAEVRQSVPGQSTDRSSRIFKDYNLKNKFYLYSE